MPDPKPNPPPNPPQTSVPAWDNLQNLTNNSGGVFASIGKLLKALFGG